MLFLLAAALAGPAETATIEDPGLERPDKLELPVVGGSPAVAGDWPDAAAIMYSDRRVSCTGTLIHPRWVLTAGHCPGGVESVILDSIDYLEPGAEVAVVGEVRHPDYLVTLDLTLLELAEDAPIPPRVMAPSCVVDTYLSPGASVAIVGYGASDVDASTFDSTLREALTEVIDRDCSASMHLGCDEVFDNPGLELVAGGDGVDSCVGDSGGPLYLLTDIGDLLVGVTSRGLTGFETSCGGGGIYVRSDAAMPWIESVIGKPLPTPSCVGLNRPPVLDVSPLTATMGIGGAVQIGVDDPDLDDTHTFEVTGPPIHGWATVSAAGELTYVPDDPLFVGLDRARVTVTDDGIPPIPRNLDIEVRVLANQLEGEAPRACGCQSHTAPWLWAWLLLPLSRRRWS